MNLDLEQVYAKALRKYLSGGGEEDLTVAYSLGRLALTEGIGVLDMVLLHHNVLTEIWSDDEATEVKPAEVAKAAVFLNEALSCFEITHQGFREATAVMNRVISFATVLCHELRTPLTSILTSAGMLQELLRADPGSPETKLLDNVLTSAKILKARTDDLVDIVGFQSGTLTLKIVELMLRNC